MNLRKDHYRSGSPPAAEPFHPRAARAGRRGAGPLVARGSREGGGGAREARAPGRRRGRRGRASGPGRRWSGGSGLDVGEPTSPFRPPSARRSEAAASSAPPPPARPSPRPPVSREAGRSLSRRASVSGAVRPPLSRAAAPSARLGKGGVVARAPAESPGSGPPGASEPRLTRGARRPPPPVARPGPFPGRRRRRPSDGASASLPALGAPGARVRPATSAHPPRPARSLPASRRSPSPSVARGAWDAGAGRVPGGKVGSGLVACVGREGARPASRGPWAQWGRRSAAPGGGVRSRAGSAEACVRPRVAAGGAGGVEAVAARHYPLRLVRFFGFPPIQVPSASRRGGLKTPGGPRPSALGRGGRARGESGGLALLPQTPPRRAGGRRAAVAAAVGRGRPRRPSCHRVRVRAPRPRARREPPGACGVSEHGPAGPVPDAPSSNLPTSRSLVSLCLPGRPEAPSGDVPCQGRALPPPCGGTPPFKLVRLLAVDHSARASMKNAASCEN